MSDANITTFREILVASGYSVTKARLTIFKLLSSQAPQTINELQAKAKGSVDRVSVYRNLRLFEELGIARRLYIGWKYKYELSDSFMSHHHHLTCLSCGRIMDIEDERHIDDFIAEITANLDFKPTRHQFEIEGICSNCQVKQLPV